MPSDRRPAATARVLLPVLLVLGAVGMHREASHRPRGEGDGASDVPSPPAAFEIALTIDDVPWSGAHVEAATVERLTGVMIEVLRRHRAPVAVFVNCRGGAANDRVLRAWARAGAAIGNHTTGHLDLDATPFPNWEAAVRSCHGALHRTTGHDARYFRYPALHQGRTRERREEAERLLRALGYRNAPVTIDNSDFLLAAPYLDALRVGDRAGQARIGRLMLEHDSAATAHFRRVARGVVGREVRHVLLLHANHMTADHLDALLTMLEGMGARYVSLDRALEDPVFQMPDRYVGPKGWSWLYRIDTAFPARIPPAARWDDAESRRLRAAITCLATRNRAPERVTLPPPAVSICSAISPTGTTLPDRRGRSPSGVSGSGG